MCNYSHTQAIYPLAARATPYYLRKMPAYLILLQMEVTAFHIHLPKEVYSSLWPYSSPYTLGLRLRLSADGR